jgi:uncharacterized RmlC-like cupin family protein
MSKAPNTEEAAAVGLYRHRENVIARKSMPRTGGVSAQRNTATYVKAHKRAYAWAEKAIADRHAGKPAQAKAAAEKSRYWLGKIARLEAAAGKRQRRAKR